MFFFDLPQPVAVAAVGTICIVHSVFHLPHCLLYRRLGILTGFWSLVGLGLIFGAILEYETLYITWVWYSCVYVPIMLITMIVKLTMYVFELDLKPWRVVLAIVAILFYMFMLYSVAYVYEVKSTLFTTTTTTTTTTPCPTFTYTTQPPAKTTVTRQLHSLCHLPHCLMYRRMGILTAFWSLSGLGLIFGAIMEYEFFYAMFVWYSCVYVPVMLTTMCIKLASYIFELDLKPWRILLGIVAVLFYIFMVYCVLYVYEMKNRKFFTTTSSTTTTPCPTTGTGNVTQPPKTIEKDESLYKMDKAVFIY